jgi:hypothetical protein
MATLSQTSRGGSSSSSSNGRERGRITPQVCGTLAFRAGASTLAAIVVPTLASVTFGDAQFVGASDDAVQTEAVNRYAPYLSRVGVHMLGVGGSLWLLLFAVVLGLLLGLRVRMKRNQGTRTAWATSLGVSLLFAASFWGFVANLHPGLFLSTLSGGYRYVLWVEVSYILAPLMLVLGAMGIVASLWRGTWAHRGVIAALVVLSLGGWARGIAWAKAKPRTATGYDKGVPAVAATLQKDGAKSPPSILFLAVDSLRPDHIDAENTPNIKKLVDRAVYFPHTLVTVPRTGPSWSAQLTGLSPMSNGVETMFPTQAAGKLANVALPAELSSRGYRTGVYSEYAGEFFGRIDAGFQVQCVPRVELAEISGQTLLARAPLVLAQAGMWYTMGQQERALLGDPIASLIRGMPNFSHGKVLADDLIATLDEDQRAGAARPYFALMFYSQPHFPYTSSSPYYKKYRVSGSSSQIAFGRDATNETPLDSAEDKKQLDGLYRASLAESDEEIGRLLTRLEQRGKMEDTIVVLTADHGEGLYDCPTCVGHGDNLRGMFSLEVPLAIVLPKGRYPNAQPVVEQSYVSQLDVAPTLRALLGLPRIEIHEGLALIQPQGVLQKPPTRIFTAETGEWLWTTSAVPKDRLEYPPITGIAKLENNRIVIDTKYLPVIRAAKHRAALRPPWKLSYEPSKDGVGIHLYNEVEDPTELHDVKDAHPDITKELKDELFTSILAHPYMLRTGDYIVTRPAPPPEEEL